MKTCLPKLAVFTGLSLLTLAGVTSGQTFTNLHNFTPFTTSDGGSPNGGMVLQSNVLYGTTASGGSNYAGTVFKVNTDGSGYTVLYNFSATVFGGGGGLGGGGGGIIVTGGGGGEGGSGTNTDGSRPNGLLAVSGNTLYGTAQHGGWYGEGTVFAINTDGTGFTNFHSFTAPSYNPTNTDGSSPNAGVILAGGTLYGTTLQGGPNGYGTVFEVNTNGTGFAVLQAFDGITFNYTNYSYSNPDGAQPQAHLVLSGGTLYGTTSMGGAYGGGIVFSVTTNGTGFADLHDFSDYVDGMSPNSLAIYGTQLYGSTSQGGVNYSGTLFSLNVSGANFTTLASFGYSSPGNSPYADLVATSNVLYGAAVQDPNNHSGIIFSLYTDGTGFTPLYAFSAAGFTSDTNADGSYPYGLLLASNVLYGTASGGGGGGNGTVFSVGQLGVPAPNLNINQSGTNVVLSWSALATGFTLQSTTNLVPPAWSTVSPSPVVINGFNYVTNSGTGAALFYRLSQ